VETYQHLFKLQNQVALVTGGAGILGLAFCRALCEAGATVICVDISKEALDAALAELNQTYQGQVFGFVCDIRHDDAVNQLVSDVMQQFNKIDILLNNAATKTSDLNAYFTPFAEYSLPVWREVMSVNLDGMFLMAQAVGKHMLRLQRGSIVQTASIYSLLAPDQRIYEDSYYLDREINTPAVYTASKAGVIGLTKHLATLWAAQGVRVNALCPGGVASGQNKIFHQKYSARIPMGRMAEKADIVGPMLFLASNASQYLTGQVIYADGGLTAW
jgi:NAD(P)-dependent dehydrogenase (short-subunit alcohol dehydrogenase family)